MTKTIILAAAAVALSATGATMNGMGYFPFAIVAAAVVGFLAKRRGRGAYSWFCLTCLISPLFSLPLLFTLKNRQPMLNLLAIAEEVYR
jgi:hypothetical protein